MENEEVIEVKGIVRGRDRIVPSKPFKDYAQIEEVANKCRGELKRIQVDLCDGKYVPSVSWPFTQYSKSEFQNLGSDDKTDVYLPLWESINYTADVMCENPENYIDSLIAYGFDEVILHYKSIKDGKTFTQISDRLYDTEIALILALDVSTDISDFMSFAKEYRDIVSGFQVMGIEKIGFQGQKFDPKSLEIVKILREVFQDKKIMLDGGITDQNILECRDAGVDQFCVGSYLTEANSFSENLTELKNILRD